jgi:hypothetical protein
MPHLHPLRAHPILHEVQPVLLGQHSAVAAVPPKNCVEQCAGIERELEYCSETDAREGVTRRPDRVTVRGTANKLARSERLMTSKELFREPADHGNCWRNPVAVDAFHAYQLTALGL